MLTESEAKTKWCPLSRVLLPVNQSGNRVSTFHKMWATTQGDVEYYAQQEADCRCIASSCMFWRWSSFAIANPDFQKDPQARGFCGAAGKPLLQS